MSPSFLCPGALCQIAPVEVVVVAEEIARKIPVIIRAGICGIIPVEGGVAVLSEAVEKGRRCIELIGRSEVVLQDCDRLVGLADTGIADFPGLITPVGVVHVVSNKVIYLLSRSVLGASLPRSCKESHPDLMGVAEPLVGSEIIGKGTIVNSLYPVVSTKTSGDVTGKGPSVVQLSRSV